MPADRPLDHDGLEVPAAAADEQGHLAVVHRHLADAGGLGPEPEDQPPPALPDPAVAEADDVAARLAPKLGDHTDVADRGHDGLLKTDPTCRSGRVRRGGTPSRPRGRPSARSSPVAHAAAEGGFVEGRAADRRVHVLELAEGEVLREQREADIRVVELAAQPLHGERQDVGVVEGEGEGGAVLRDGRDRAAGLARPGHDQRRRRQRGAARQGLGEGRLRQQRQIGDRDDAHPRIPVHGTEGVELLEPRPPDPGLVAQDALRGGVEGFGDAHEPARQGPEARLRLLAPPQQESGEPPRPDPQQDEIHRQGGPLVGRRIVACQELGFGHRSISTQVEHN